VMAPSARVILGDDVVTADSASVEGPFRSFYLLRARLIGGREPGPASH
jgi:hypothetical protein